MNPHSVAVESQPGSAVVHREPAGIPGGGERIPIEQPAPLLEGWGAPTHSSPSPQRVGCLPHGHCRRRLGPGQRKAKMRLRFTAASEAQEMEAEEVASQPAEEVLGLEIVQLPEAALAQGSGLYSSLPK
ncbi:hypothetical protein KIL84_016944 [Mauremys mutica]|uniref:Uncharacterized protein n=1 Tax=Mauremys mutica TaxID=74926 RepID=A0A9D3X5X0_9SAUR|nr:hypothetical protein KIL84_016944 [Mauremys mutica]